MPKIINDKDIYNAVIELFSTQGYVHTTTKSIADKTGINEATLFRKYRNKEQLFIKAVYWYFSSVSLNNITFTGNLKADLEQISFYYVDTSKYQGYLVPLLLLEVSRHPELSEAIDILKQNMAKIVNIFEKYQKRGEIRSDMSPEMTMNAFLGPFFTHQLGIRSGFISSAGPVSHEKFISLFLEGYAV